MLLQGEHYQSEDNHLQAHYWRECYNPTADYCLRLEDTTTAQECSLRHDKWQLQQWGYYQFSDGLRVEPTTVALRGGVKLQAPSLLPAPHPQSYKARTTGHATCGSRTKGVQSARALHYDGDYSDSSEREQSLRDDRRTRRLQRQELLLWLYVIVCVTTIMSTWRRKRD